jgi:hypothetical protein
MILQPNEPGSITWCECRVNSISEHSEIYGDSAHSDRTFRVMEISRHSKMYGDSGLQSAQQARHSGQWRYSDILRYKDFGQFSPLSEV